MTGQSNQKRRHTRLDIELKAVLGYEGGVECSVLTDNLSFSGARFSLMVPIESTQADVLPPSDLSEAPLESAGPEVTALETSIEADASLSDEASDLESPVLTEGAVVRPSQALPLTVREDALAQSNDAESHDAQWAKTQELEVSHLDAVEVEPDELKPESSVLGLAETQELELPDTVEIDALVEQVEVEDAQAEASDATRTESDNTRDTHDAALAPTLEVEAEAFEREPSAPKLEPVDLAEPGRGSAGVA